MTNKKFLEILKKIKQKVSTLDDRDTINYIDGIIDSIGIEDDNNLSSYWQYKSRGPLETETVPLSDLIDKNPATNPYVGRELIYRGTKHNHDIEPCSEKNERPSTERTDGDYRGRWVMTCNGQNTSIK